MSKIFKQYTCKAEIDEDERTVTAIINTATVDRDREIVLPKGADLEQYLKNPVVQWAHDYSSPPVAKALWVKKGRKNIKAKMKFATKEQSPRADEIFQLYKGGFLNAFSIGFISTEGHSPTPDEIKKNPEWAEARYIIDNWEMLEFSAVPVPANPEALALAVKSKAVSVSEDLAEELSIPILAPEGGYYLPERITDELVKASSDEEKEESYDVQPIEIKTEPIPVLVRPLKVDAVPIKYNVTSIVDVGEIATEAMLQAKGKIYT